MVIAKKYVVTKLFDKKAKKSDFKIVKEELAPIKDGEILVKSEWISVDPYQRSVQSLYKVQYVQYGYQIGTVVESKDANFPVGSQVVSHEGWRNYYVTNPSKKFKSRAERVYIVPDLKGLPTSYALSAAGMIGVTAYFGLVDILQAKSGDTVVVTCAAGAVGSLVGQIAKIKGCKVIGIVGSKEKVEWLEEKLGYDKAINYKTANMNEALKDAAPNGVDCYFDSVGGELSSIIMSFMNPLGRVGVCGWISAYNEQDNLPTATILQPSILMKTLTVKGFKVFQWADWAEPIEKIIEWIKEDKIVVREHITEGFDNLFEALDGMLSGENTGKALVKV